MSEFRVDVVIYEEGDHWIAQGLQFDITAQARTPTDLPGRFMRAMVSEVAVALELGEEPLVSVPQAPKRFFAMFKSARATLTVDEDLPVMRVPNRAVLPRIVPRMKMAHADAS